MEPGEGEKEGEIKPPTTPSLNPVTSGLIKTRSEK